MKDHAAEDAGGDVGTATAEEFAFKEQPPRDEGGEQPKKEAPALNVHHEHLEKEKRKTERKLEDLSTQLEQKEAMAMRYRHSIRARTRIMIAGVVILALVAAVLALATGMIRLPALRREVPSTRGLSDEQMNKMLNEDKLNTPDEEPRKKPEGENVTQPPVQPGTGAPKSKITKIEGVVPIAPPEEPELEFP